MPCPRLDPIERMLCGMIIALTMMAFASALWLPNDAQNYGLLSGLVATFTGALIGRITKFSGVTPAPGSSTESVEVKRTSTPPPEGK